MRRLETCRNVQTDAQLAEKPDTTMHNYLRPFVVYAAILAGLLASASLEAGNEDAIATTPRNTATQSQDVDLTLRVEQLEKEVADLRNLFKLLLEINDTQSAIDANKRAMDEIRRKMNTLPPNLLGEMSPSRKPN